MCDFDQREDALATAEHSAGALTHRAKALMTVCLIASVIVIAYGAGAATQAASSGIQAEPLAKQRPCGGSVR